MNRVNHKPNRVVNNIFVQTMEMMGYDIESYYVKRDGVINE